MPLALAATLAPASTLKNPPKLEEMEVEAPATRAFVHALLSPQGSDTNWSVEYATSEAGPWKEVANGTCPLEAGFDRCQANPEAEIHNLTPKKPYYARIVAENEDGHISETKPFTTTAVSAPEIPTHGCYRVTAGENHPICAAPRTTSVLLETQIQTNGAKTEYHLEYATAEGGPYTPVPGGAGSVTVAEDFANPQVELKGLAPETLYYVRAVAENEKGTTPALVSFKTHTVHPQASFNLV